jgi:hypothetical protein
MPAGNTYVALATQTLGSAAASVTFSSIPSTYTDLILIMNARNTNANTYPFLRFNSDTGTNYSITDLVGSAAGAVSYGSVNQSVMNINYSDALPSGASTFAGFIINIQNYSNTTTNKTILCRVSNSATATEALVGLWRNTSAINTITLTCDSGSYNTGSTFSLYGIAAA